ncbi:MAG: ABC transporter permease [Pseudomonadota bacterium]
MTGAGLIWKNAARKKLRLVLTVISIFTAFLIYGILGSFQNSLDAGIDVASGANRLVTVNKITFIQPLPYAYVGKVKAMEGVAGVTYAVWFGGYYQDPQRLLAVFGVDPESYLAAYPELVLTPEERKAFLTDRRALLVGKKMADRFGWKVGETIPIQSNIWSDADGSQTWDFIVAGIFTANDDKIDTSYLLFHYDYLNERRRFARDTIGWLIVTTTTPAANDAVAKAIDLEFSNAPTQTKTDTEKAFNQSFVKQFGNIGLIVVSVTGAAFFTILLIAGNTMMLSVRERTPEIAVMKTLGFDNGRIFRLVIFEALFVTALGALPALALASLMLQGLSAAMAGMMPPMFMTGAMFAKAVGVMLLLALLTGFIPAWSAMRINIVTALGRR